MDYGPTLTATYEVGDDGANFAYKGIAVRLDAGPGGVSRGRHWTVFDHDTMRLAAAWSGDGFIDWNGINFNGRHEIHPRVVGLVEFANPIGPGWANPETGIVRRPATREAATAGPTARSRAPGPITGASTAMATDVILAYTVGKTDVLETPGGRDREARLRSSPGPSTIGPRDEAPWCCRSPAGPGSSLRTSDSGPDAADSRRLPRTEPARLHGTRPNGEPSAARILAVPRRPPAIRE